MNPTLQYSIISVFLLGVIIFLIMLIRLADMKIANMQADIHRSFLIKCEELEICAINSRSLNDLDRIGPIEEHFTQKEWKNKHNQERIKELLRVFSKQKKELSESLGHCLSRDLNWN